LLISPTGVVVPGCGELDCVDDLVVINVEDVDGVVD